MYMQKYEYLYIEESKIGSSSKLNKKSLINESFMIIAVIY